MSFEFIDLTGPFRKTVTKRFAAIFINHLPANARTDNIQPFIKKIEYFRYFYA